MGEIKFMKALVFISIFAIAIVGYALGFAADNGSVVEIDQHGELTALNSSAQNNTDSLYLDTENSSKSFFLSKLVGTDTTTRTGGEFKIGLRSMVGTMSTITKTTKKSFFGDNPAFAAILTAFTSFLLYMGIRYIWKTWKGGNPD